MDSSDATLKTRDDIVTVNCTVVFMAQCLSSNKCKQNCESMGATSYRYVTDMEYELLSWMKWNSFMFFSAFPDGFLMGVANVLDPHASIMAWKTADAHSVPIQKTLTY